MITVLMIILLVTPLAMGIESIIYVKKSPKLAAVFGGVAGGLFLWNTYGYFLVAPLISVGFCAIAALFIVIQVIRNNEHIKILAIMVFASALITYTVWDIGFISLAEAEHDPDIQVFNEGNGREKIFMVYHPGFGSIQEIGQTVLSETLAEMGFEVHLHSVHETTPTDMSDYDMVIISAQTYNWLPAKRIQDYIGKVENTEGIEVFGMISAAGYTELSRPTLGRLLEDAGFDLITVAEFTTAAPIYLEGEHMDVTDFMIKFAEEVAYETTNP